MALIRKQSSWGQSQPRVWEHPVTGDIIIGGIAYDRNTFLPKVGIDVGYGWDGNVSPGGATATTSAYFTMQLAGYEATNGSAAYYDNNILGSCITSPRSIHVHREIYKNGNFGNAASSLTTINGGTAWLSDFNRRYEGIRSDIHTRDWYEQKNACNLMYDSTSNRFIGAAQIGDLYNGATSTGFPTTYLNWRNSPGADVAYQTQAMLGSYLLAGLNVGGALGIGPGASGTSMTRSSDELKVIRYSANVSLETTSDTTLMAFQSSTNGFEYITLLSTLDNGDRIFVKKHNNGSTASSSVYQTFRVANVVASTITTVSSTSLLFNVSHPMPSQMVRHHDSGSVNLNRKIAYTVLIAGTTGAKNWPPTATSGGNVYIRRTSIDQSTGSISEANCTITNTGSITAANVAWSPIDSTTSAGYAPAFQECRIIRDTTLPNGNVWVMATQITGGNPQSSSTPNTNSAGAFSVAIYRASLAADTTLDLVYWSNWLSILTTPSGYAGSQMLPWCIAPINQEHTLFMVFCQRSTHMVRFDTTTQALTETWVDSRMMINGVMWLDSGKVVTDGWDMGRLSGAGQPQIYSTEQHVWADDLIYRVDLIVADPYKEYTGTNTSTTLSISAYNAAGNRIVANLRTRIVGSNAQFSDGSSLKVTTTSATGAVTEAITITGPGNVEFQVVDIQGG